MNELVLMLILIATTAYVAKPYWQRQNAVGLNFKNYRINDLTTRRDNLLNTIKEIEFDFKMGKVSKEDFELMNTKYRLEAIKILKQIDALRGNNRASSKNALKSGNASAIPKKSPTHFCAQCGRAVRQGDRFCIHCGIQLPE